MAATVRDHVARGQRVLVATLFSHAGPRDAGPFLRSDYPLRRAEDEASCRLMGASVIHCGLLDAPFRGTGYRDLPGICFATRRREAADQARATALAQKLVHTLRPRRVYAPLGVGEHVDHRLTHNAARAVSHAQVWFYEDRPYAFVRHATALRLHVLGLGDFKAVWLDALLKSLRSAPMLTGLAGPQIAKCARGFALQQAAAPVAHHRRARAVVKRFPAECARFAQRVLECHASQVQGIVGGRGKYAGLSTQFAAAQGHKGYIERFWRL